MRLAKRLAVAFPIAGIVLFLLSCCCVDPGGAGGKFGAPAANANEKVTRENYNKITVNMNYDKVKEIIGPGKEAVGGQGHTVLTWNSADNQTIISITFTGDLVDAKSIIGP